MMIIVSLLVSVVTCLIYNFVIRYQLKKWIDSFFQEETIRIKELLDIKYYK